MAAEILEARFAERWDCLGCPEVVQMALELGEPVQCAECGQWRTVS